MEVFKFQPGDRFLLDKDELAPGVWPEHYRGEVVALLDDPDVLSARNKPAVGVTYGIRFDEYRYAESTANHGYHLADESLLIMDSVSDAEVEAAIASIQSVMGA